MLNYVLNVRVHDKLCHTFLKKLEVRKKQI